MPKGRASTVLHTVDQAQVEDRIHQLAALPEVVAHVLQPIGVQPAHCLAILGHPEGDGHRIVLSALLMALRFVEEGQDLHFCWICKKGGKVSQRVMETCLTRSSGIPQGPEELTSKEKSVRLHCG